MPFDALPARAFLAVYPSVEDAEQVIEDLRRVGIGDEQIRLDDAGDVTTSLEAEVHEEITESFISPQAGIAYPKEATKAMVVFMPPAIAVGAVLGAVLAAVVGPEAWGLWLRLFVGAVTGGTMGGAIASIVLPAMAVKNPLDPSAADAGVTLWVGSGVEEVRQVLEASSPRRLDRLGAHDQPLGTVTTEEQTSDGGIAEELAENFAREHRADPEDRTR